MKLRQSSQGVVFVGVALMLVACAHEETIKTSPVQLPDSFGDTAVQSPRPEEDTRKWWTELNDPQLDQWVDVALEDSFELRQAWSRMEQFQAIARQQGAADMPQLQASFGAQRSRSTNPVFGTSSVSNRLSLSLAASYEVDVWGRIESLQDAASMDVQASREDLSTIAVTLVARLADTWFALVEQRARQALLNQQIEVSSRFLELVSLRFGQGLATALDVYQQRQQLASIQSQLPLLEAQQGTLEHQLAVLMGKPAGSLEMGDGAELPDLPPLPARGVPSDLLIQRPDLRSAQLRLASQDRRVAAAVADQFPSVRLTGSMSYQGQSLGDIFDQFIWGLAGELVLPIIDGERREAEVERQRAALEERLGAFGQSVLVALQEVEDALLLEKNQGMYRTQLEQQRELAQLTLDQATARYTGGLTDYLPVLNALASLQQTEQSLISAKRLQISYRIQLYRALGGTWTDELQAPASEDAEPVEEE